APAGDTVPYYRALVRELQGAGYRVKPEPDKDLCELGKEMRSAVIKALAEAEASIHLLGTSTGGSPDDLQALVPMQLAAAAAEAKRKPGFERMIWAPTVLPAGTSPTSETARRDPLEILDRFGQELLPRDQVDGQTASGFNQFVLQHLRKIVYI